MPPTFCMFVHAHTYQPWPYQSRIAALKSECYTSFSPLRLKEMHLDANTQCKLVSKHFLNSSACSHFFTFALMTTGAFSRNVGKLFSELKLVTNSLLSNCFDVKIHEQTHHLFYWHRLVTKWNCYCYTNGRKWSHQLKYCDIHVGIPNLLVQHLWFCVV